jgi:LmbE family N-acetylglucosaminyl deacetylase
LSLGGLISALTSFTRVEVWSLFCGASLRGPYSDLADWLHSSSGGLSGSRLAWARKLEDRRACRRLGAKARHFPWKDSPYRKTRDGNFMYQTIQPGAVHEEETDLIAAIAAQLRRQVSGDDVILAPLAIGGHVDHMITRIAAEALGAPTLMYYPEVPYLQLFPGHLDEASTGLCPVQYVLRRDEIVTWIDSLKFYVTQMQMLEPAVGRIPQAIGKYANEPLAIYRACDRDSTDLNAYRIFG